jgi:hypothetical protein
MHNWYYQYVDHVGLYLHASDESHHRAHSYGQEMIVDCSKASIYIGAIYEHIRDQQSKYSLLCSLVLLKRSNLMLDYLLQV